ncbi:MAG: enoyl-CoA hydratase-related protein [Deltaproteobacteria bacterium]|jgi:2-(1,2-epoxy-1,2-dihydrophenyl)acetyl-CoA isomerase|nr:enoyl-CoA hydratase-related protein [Deltaproteobacteria bacterium]
MDKDLVSAREGAVAVLTLNRPEVFNALDLALGEALLDALIECDQDDRVRAVLLTGAGRAFCAGGDIRAMAAAGPKAAAFLEKLTVFLHASVATIARMPKPVIMAVNGPAAGAGFSLALAGDLLVASERATFTVAYTKIGLAPDGSSTFFLPRIVGCKRAFDLMASNRALAAAEAYELGLVSAVFAESEFEARAREISRHLAAGPTQALARTKRLLALEATLETQMESERQAISACARSEDFREGIKGFLDKRAVVFAGR